MKKIIFIICLFLFSCEQKEKQEEVVYEIWANTECYHTNNYHINSNTGCVYFTELQYGEKLIVCGNYTVKRIK